jgi:toxin secretion/phage lysis holin
MRFHSEDFAPIKWVLAGIAALTTSIPELTYFLLTLMVIDSLFGIAASIKTRRLTRNMAWMAATKKLGSLGFIVLAAVIDTYIDLLGIDLVQVTTVFYIGPELVSILRNAATLEIPVPPQFAHVLRYFQDKEKESADKPVPQNPS